MTIFAARAFPARSWSCSRRAVSTKRSRPSGTVYTCWNRDRRAEALVRRGLFGDRGVKNAIAFDMGGTTAKAGVIHKGEALTTGAALIGGYDRALPVQIAMMDIFEVGTGGGSLAAA